MEISTLGLGLLGCRAVGSLGRGKRDIKQAQIDHREEKLH